MMNRNTNPNLSRKSDSFFMLLMFELLFAALFSTQALANYTRVQTSSTLQFKYNGQRYILRPQTFDAQCSSSYCVFNSNGVRVAIPSQYVRQVSTPTYYAQQTARSYETVFDGNGSHELATGSESFGASGSGAPMSSYGFEYSAKGRQLATCYRDRGRYYSGRRGCTNGNRRCTGTKNQSVSTNKCYRYVKLILQDCGGTSGYLPGVAGKDGGPALLRAGYTKLSTKDPARAPAGSVIVYSNQCRSTHWAGHIEIKVSDREYVSDYIDSKPRSAVTSCRKVTGIYIKN